MLVPNIEELKQLSNEISTRVLNFFSEEIIEEAAKETGFVQRKSKLKAWMFLETMMFQFKNQKKLSLVDLCRDIFVFYGIRLRKQSLDERFNIKAILFIKRIISKAITNFACQPMDTSLFSAFKRVKIKDSTSFELPENMSERYPGNRGFSSKAGMNIQFEYDLKTSNITDLSLCSKKENDCKNAKMTFADIAPGDLIIRDLGYVSINLLKSISQKDAYYLNRLKPQVLVFEKVSGKYCRLSTKTIANKLRKSQRPYIAMELYIGDKKFLPCRVIFYLVPDDKVKERKKRQLAKATRRGSNVDTKVLDSLDLNIFITNTTEEQIPSSKVYDVYRLRWQIELIFKAWKQNCEINTLKIMNPNRLETVICAQLLWIIMNWNIINRYGQHYFGQINKLLSIHKSFKTLSILKSEFRRALHNRIMLYELFITVGEALSEDHYREKRKGHVFSTEILMSLMA